MLVDERQMIRQRAISLISCLSVPENERILELPQVNPDAEITQK